MNMTKNELKAALDLAGVAYAKKANLEALRALYAEHIGQLNEDGTAAVSQEDEDDGFTMSEEELAQQAGRSKPDETYAEVDGKPVDTCPSCGIHLSNGLLHVDDCAANTNKTYREQRDPEFAKGEWQCMGCGHNFGAIPEFAPEPGTGLKIEKDRPEQNGIKRPSVGGKCRAIWDALDAYREETGELPTSKVVKELAADEGWNPNNASIEFYQWRKFHGIGKAA
jgi:hypothetical protein